MSTLPQFPKSEPADHRARLESATRLAELDKTGLMDGVPEEVYDRAVRLARQVTGAPVGLLSLVNDKEQFFKAHAGLEETDPPTTGTPLSHSFCQYVVSSRTSLAVVDARTHPLLAGNGAVSDLGVIAYLGVPVRGPSGEVLGSFCTIDREAHDWTEEQLQALEDIAGIVESEIRLHRALAERDLLVQELHHRVKNLFTVVNGMVRLSRRNEEPQEDLEKRLQSLANAHNLIAPAIHAGEPVGDRIALDEMLDVLLTPYGKSRLAPFEGPRVILGPRASTSLALALHELATNAAKYGALATPDGRLTIGWRISGNEMEMTWEEIGRAAEAPGTPGGFGTKLIGLAVEGQMGGTVETELREAGMFRRITLPRERLAE